MPRFVRPAWVEINGTRQTTIGTGPRSRDGDMEIALFLRTPSAQVSDPIAIIAGGDPACAMVRIPTDAFDTEIEVEGNATVLIIRPR